MKKLICDHANMCPIHEICDHADPHEEEIDFCTTSQESCWVCDGYGNEVERPTHCVEVEIVWR